MTTGASPRKRKRSSYLQTEIVLQGNVEPFHEFQDRVNKTMVKLQDKMKFYENHCIALPCCSSEGRMTMTIVYVKSIPAVKSKRTVRPAIIKRI